MKPVKVTHFTRRPAGGAFSIERVFDDVRSGLPEQIDVKVAQSKFLSQGFLPRLRDTLGARHHLSEVNHIVGDVHFLAILMPKDRTIVTVHDTLIVERERGLKRFILWLFWLWLPLRHCARVTTISQESRRRLLELVRLDPARVEVIANPLSASFVMAPQPARQGAFRVLHIGTKKNKNLERLTEALTGLDVELTVVGRLSPSQQAVLDRCLPDAVRNLVDLDDAQLRQEYVRSDAVAFVSLSEGFGLPILEAQATGRPVLTSAMSPMDDVAGEGAVLVDPEDTGEIRQAMIQLMSDVGLREKLIARGIKNIGRFSQDAISQQYAELYAKVAGEAQSKAK